MDRALRPATTAYRSRDQLLTGRVDGFSFPDVGPIFNWANDWFDVIARGNFRPALVFAADDGQRTAVTFDEPALWDCMLAAMKAEAVVVPTTTALGPSDLQDRVARSGARYVLCGPQDTARFDGFPDSVGQHPQTAADDPLLCYFTSGTTSRPKLVTHTHTSYPVGHLSTMYWIGVKPGDVHCNVSSPGWAKHAWSCFFAPWAAEATVFVFDSARFDAAALLAKLREERVTTCSAPPTVWRMLITADLSGGPGTLREVVAAGEPLNPEVIAQVQRHWGLTIRDGYGQTETTALVGSPPSATVRPGSMGRPLPGVPIALVDVATGLPATGEGEICLDLSCRPVNLMTGYADGGDAMAGGYYHTGHVASMDTSGTITFIGRTDDVFKSSDYKVSPFEVESVLIENAHEHLAPYKRVRRIEFFDLPKTISGKIRRVELRAREQARREAPDEWREEQFAELKA